MECGERRFVDRNRGSSGFTGFVIPNQFLMLPVDEIGVQKYD